MKNVTITTLKIALVLLGLYGIFLGLDFGIGGFKSLGWQGTTEFFEVTDTVRYQVQDNHFRFFGGVFIGVGVFLMFALILLGGLTRFSAGNVETLLIPEIIVAQAVEIGLMIGLYFWLRRVLKHLSTQK